MIRLSPIRQVAMLLDEARKRGDIISFGGGAPSVPPAEEVVDAICDLVKNNSLRVCGYTGSRGRMELRNLIAQDVEKYGGVEYAPESQVIVTDGGTEGIFSALMAILNKNDEVVITDPTYLGYNEAVKLAGGRIKTLPVTVEKDYQPDIEDLKRIISNRTKAFVLLSPDNPTGRIIDKKFAKGLVDLAVDHDFWIISDDTYKHIVYEGEHIWINSLPGAYARTVLLCSFSKEASIPGLRLGYALGPTEIIDAMEKIKQYASLAPNTIGQYAMVKFLSDNVKERYLSGVVIPTYRKRRDLMSECLKKYLPEAKTVKPKGAFYFFVNMSAYLAKMEREDEEFSKRLLYRKNVAVIPGSFFGPNGQQHIRLTFVSEPEERIDAGIKGMGEYVFSYTF
jgi:aspartate aminotransferase